MQRTSIVGTMLAALRGPEMNAGWWLAVIAVTSGTNLLDFFAAAQQDARGSALFAAAAVVRILLVFWIAYAVLRRLAGVPSPVKITAAFFRYALFALGVVVVMAACATIAALVTGGGARQLSSALTMYLVMTGIMMLLIRFYAWQAALAAGDRTLGPVGAWRSLAGLHGRLAAAYLLVAAVAVLHVGLTHTALELGDQPALLALLALVDGIVSGVQLVLAAALAVAAWRAARERMAPLRDETALA